LRYEPNKERDSGSGERREDEYAKEKERRGAILV
jgi:hypothetical protein